MFPGWGTLCFNIRRNWIFCCVFPGWHILCSDIRRNRIFCCVFSGWYTFCSDIRRSWIFCYVFPGWYALCAHIRRSWIFCFVFPEWHTLCSDIRRHRIFCCLFPGWHTLCSDIRRHRIFCCLFPGWHTLCSVIRWNWILCFLFSKVSDRSSFIFRTSITHSFCAYTIFWKKVSTCVTINVVCVMVSTFSVLSTRRHWAIVIQFNDVRIDTYSIFQVNCYAQQMLILIVLWMIKIVYHIINFFRLCWRLSKKIDLISRNIWWNGIVKVLSYFKRILFWRYSNVFATVVFSWF